MIRKYCFAASALMAAVMMLTQQGFSAEEKKKTAEPTQEELEKQFSEKLTGAVLNGTFTIQGTSKSPSSDKYTISSAKKIAGDNWVITARMQYGNHDVNFPFPVKVKWAGDTPVITVTEFTFPGIGTFTARVLFYGDRYAGTWQHDKVGGHMTGLIERAPAQDSKTKTPDAKPKEANK